MDVQVYTQCKYQKCSFEILVENICTLLSLIKIYALKMKCEYNNCIILLSDFIFFYYKSIILYFISSTVDCKVDRILYLHNNNC